MITYIVKVCMQKIEIFQDEDVFYSFLTGNDVDPEYNIEIDDSILFKWKNIQKEYDKMQEELATYRKLMALYPRK